MGSCFALLLKLVLFISCVCTCCSAVARKRVFVVKFFNAAASTSKCELHNSNRQSATKLLQLQWEGSCAFIAAAAARMHLLAEGGLCGINEKGRVSRREATKELNNQRLHSGTRTCNANHLARFSKALVRLAFAEGNFRNNSRGWRAEYLKNVKKKPKRRETKEKAGNDLAITS